ncbi:retrovirus-related Pol polyprotein from transposon 17.6 [Caerostris darwini]|uniref:Retrovirus-related Pol polyprotein from transposon 17.6 n=1 Tax=Caerostris darwini TaxID=1538125 RepID=A0AAV4X045_9ARAC|nr:retrovirus-related Pol polyprotein from transposon 17.6 [Caerostris darwini]
MMEENVSELILPPTERTLPSVSPQKIFGKEQMKVFVDSAETGEKDGIVIYSHSCEDPLKHIDEVLRRVNDAKPSKFKFTQNHTKYLGHLVGDAIRMLAEAKINAVLDFSTPTTKMQITAFLGLVGYYAHYKKNVR